MTRPASYQARVPAVVAEYVRRHVDPDPLADIHPIIVEKFIPGRGWVSTAGFRKRVSVSWARKLKMGEGVTHVALRVTAGRAATGRVADFSVDEIIRGGTS